MDHRKTDTSFCRWVISFWGVLASLDCLVIFDLGDGPVWSKGELGDFVNGLGGIAFFIICLTSYLQHEELKRHRIQASESDILRAFEVLKPELENLSVRIVARISLSKKGEGYTEEFQKWHNRFNNENDRTVFLRRL